MIRSSSDFVVVVMTNFIRILMRTVFRERVQVRCSDLVGSDLPHPLSSMFDKLLHLSKSESFAMSCSRRRDLREAVGNLLTVTTYPQDTLSRFHVLDPLSSPKPQSLHNFVT